MASSEKELIGRKARWAQILQELDLQLHCQKGKYNIMVDTLNRMLMVNELSFTIFKSSLLESLKGLCEHDNIYSEIWQSVQRRNTKMQPSNPSLETSISPERLAEFSTGGKASFDPERSNEYFGFRAKAEPSEVDLSPSFALDSLDGVKLCQGERFRLFSIDDEYLLYKGRVCVPSLQG